MFWGVEPEDELDPETWGKGSDPATGLREAIEEARAQAPNVARLLLKHVRRPNRQSQAVATMAKLLLDLAARDPGGKPSDQPSPGPALLILTPEQARAELARRGEGAHVLVAAGEEPDASCH